MITIFILVVSFSMSFQLSSSHKIALFFLLIILRERVKNLNLSTKTRYLDLKRTYYVKTSEDTEQRIIIQMHSIQYPQTDQYCCDIRGFYKAELMIKLIGKEIKYAIIIAICIVGYYYFSWYLVYFRCVRSVL